MRFVLRRFTLLSNIRMIVVCLLGIVLMFGTANFIMPSVFNQIARAVEQEPTCTNGEIYYDGFSSFFTIKLNCSDLPVSASATSNDKALVNPSLMKLWDGASNYSPENIAIDSNILSLVFSTNNKYPKVGTVIIDAGAIMNESLLANDTIVVPASEISDFANPIAEDDDYTTIQGGELNIPVESGVLSNDSDDRDGVLTAAVSTEPAKGILTLNYDGSFAYAPTANYDGIDSFRYTVTDESGRCSTANVLISDDVPIISLVDARRDNPEEDPNFAKVGDTIRIDFETSEPVEIVSAMIAGRVASVDILDTTHFSIYCVMQESDEEGVVRYSLVVRDSVGKTAPGFDETVVYFDKTKPIIDLGGSNYAELEVDDFYEETVSAVDAQDGQITVYYDISVDTSVAGIYVVTYNAVDSAGNQADEVTRTVVVMDSTTKEFKDISDGLMSLGLDNNLNMINADNYSIFSGLYIEKLVDGAKFGRITFNNAIDFSNEDVKLFLDELLARMTSDEVGVIGFNIEGMTDLLDYFGTNITIKFYNLDKLGFNNASTLSDVLSKLNVYDDSGKKMNNSGLDKKSGVYAGCLIGNLECYTFTINIDHFSKYVISKIEYPKVSDAIIPVSSVNLANSAVLSTAAISRLDSVFSQENTDNQVTLGAHANSSSDELVSSKKQTNQTTKKASSQVVAALAWQWFFMIGLAVVLSVWALYVLFFYRHKI